MPLIVWFKSFNAKGMSSNYTETLVGCPGDYKEARKVQHKQKSTQT